MGDAGKHIMLAVLHGISITLLAIIGTYLMKASNSADIDLSSVEQYGEDWKAITYTKIDIDHNARQYDTCKSGYEPIFQAYWPGTKVACDCSTTSRYIEPYRRGLRVDHTCDYDTERYCNTIRANPGKDLPIVHQSIVCGKANGPSFINAVRPDPKTKKCPSGTEACSKLTTPENTICVTAGSELKKVCPITQVIVKPDSQVDAFIGNSSAKWDHEDWDDYNTILWSQDFNSLPITSNKIEKTPCMNPTQNSMYDGFIPFEAERGFNSCEKSVTNNQTYDPRYTKTGIDLNLYELHYDNGVMTQMQASFHNNFNMNIEVQKRRQQNLFLWTRPTLSWDLQCEAVGSNTSRKDMSTAVANPIEFPDRIFVAAIFAFICIGIEACACGCGFISSANQGGDYIGKTMGRTAATICSGLFVVNIAWMAATGASILREQSAKVDSYAMINKCSDDVTNLPVEDIQRRFETGADQSTFASYLVYGLLATYFVSCLIILRQMAKHGD